MYSGGMRVGRKLGDKEVLKRPNKPWIETDHVPGSEHAERCRIVEPWEDMWSVRVDEQARPCCCAPTSNSNGLSGRNDYYPFIAQR